ncbi:MAG: PIN domain-containing protein [Kiritimatiellae bacterium]|nr:PIN domain-containing protein [Kiritimatiellia bacterium]MDD5521820.1 PIN domain-containing protein [Kiritimatiellia bacterium]
MIYGLDTSIVLRLLTGEPKELALQAVRRITALVDNEDSCVISDLVAAETYYALQFHYKMPKGDALSALMLLGKDDHGIRFSGATGKVLQTPRLSQANPGFVDRLIYAGYQQEGHAMLTCEHAAKKLAGVEVVGG